MRKMDSKTLRTVCKTFGAVGKQRTIQHEKVTFVNETFDLLLNNAYMRKVVSVAIQ